MICIPIGRINVPTAGTPVTLALSMLTTGQQAALPPSGQVAKIEVWPDPAAAGKVYVKQGGTIIAALPVAATGAAYPWSSPEREFNQICALQISSAGIGFQIDAATNGDGAYVTLWVT
jgi:hypothetical protein